MPRARRSGVNRCQKGAWRRGLDERDEVGSKSRVVERPPRAAPATVFTGKVTSHVAVVLHLVEVAIESARGKPVTKGRDEFGRTQGSAVCGKSDSDGDLDSIHAHPGQRVEPGREWRV
jgi:hypothetical protein